jgi:integrase
MAEIGIRETSPGRWEIRAYNREQGRQEYASYDSGRRTAGAGIREARRARSQLVADIAAGKYGGSKGTLGQLVDQYIDHRRKSGASPTTIRAYRSIARAIANGPGGKRLDKLTARDLDAWYADLIDGGMTRATVHHHHRLVSAVLAQGERWGVVPSNVARLTTDLKVPRPQMNVPPPADVVRLIDHAAASRAPDMAALIVTAALTGCRRGELCALRWSDVHDGYLTVARSVWQTRGEWGVKDTKSHQERTVHTGPRLASVLDLVRRQQVDQASAAGVELVADPYVFSPDADGATPKMPDVITQRFAKFCESLGVRYRFHDLRHYAATELVAAGYSMVTVSKRLGHSQVSTTANIYTHVVEDQAIAAGSALDDALA